MLKYSNAPLDSHLPSPSQSFFARRLKGLRPIKDNLLKPIYTYSIFDRELKNRQLKQQNYINKKFKDLYRK